MSLLFDVVAFDVIIGINLGLCMCCSINFTDSPPAVAMTYNTKITIPLRFDVYYKKNTLAEFCMRFIKVFSKSSAGRSNLEPNVFARNAIDIHASRTTCDLRSLTVPCRGMSRSFKCI